MKQGLLSGSPCRPFLSLPPSLSTRSKTTHFPKASNSVSATLNTTEESPLTARERRQLRKERRETKPAYNWREEVEERLIKKTKKRYASWTEELNLDNLALLGPQWWVVRVSRVSGQITAELLARSLARNFPDMDFKLKLMAQYNFQKAIDKLQASQQNDSLGTKVYVPAVQVKRKLKNGSLSVKPKSLFPGCVFLRCILNKEIHDFIREYDGVGGFVGSKVGNKKRQINKPRPVSTDDMEAIFQQTKEEQAKTDLVFEEEKQAEGAVNLEDLNVVYTDSQLSPKDSTESVIVSKPRRQSRKTSSSPTGDKLLRKGCSVRILSGPFAEFTGVLKKLERKTGRATVGFTLFGKKTLVDLDVNEIVVENK